MSSDGVQYFFEELIPAGVPIPREGLSKTSRLRLRRDHQMVLLENASETNDQYRPDNPSISVLGRYTLDPWPEHLPDAVPCTLELRIFPDLEFVVNVEVSGLSAPQPLVRTQEHWKENQTYVS